MASLQVNPPGGVLKYFKASIAYLVLSTSVGLLMLLGMIDSWGFHGHVHVALLGFVSLTIMGAMFQIVPTLLGTQISNPRFAGVQFWLINIGIIGLTASFLRGRILLLPFAALTAIASYMFVYLILATKWTSKAPLNLTMKFFLSALLYFSISIALGVALASQKLSQVALFYMGNFSVAHVHLALLAFVGLTIMGALYQMLPMLSLKKLYSPKLGDIQFWLMNIGVLGFATGLLIPSRAILAVFSIVLVSAVYLFIYNMYKTLRGEGGKFDVSVKFFAAALTFLTVGCTLGVLMTVFHSALFGLKGILSAHAHIASMGFVTLTIMGAMYHLVPMLVWMARYSEKLGKEPVPPIAEMYNQRLANFQFTGATLGAAGFVLGLLTINGLAMISASVFLISVYLFAYIMYKMMGLRGI